MPIIDLRSESEYTEDHLPGATSRPLFDDTERALVGTIYKQASPDEAYARGIEITQAKIAVLVREIAKDAGHEVREQRVRARMLELASDGKHALEQRLTCLPAKLAELAPDGFVVHCWRGGLRSQSVCALLGELGLPAFLLEGGYKAYRAWVLEEQSALRFPPAYVLRGLTGVGKTLVLRELERLQPLSTVDLEALAAHRSSILGAAGLEPVGQKRFESRIVQRHRRGYPFGHVVFEGESRKVGSVVLPARLWAALEAGTGLMLIASLERRVQVLLDDYLAVPGSQQFLARQLPFLERRLGRRKYGGVLTGMLEAGRHAELVELLLEKYYDPLYAHSEAEHPIAAQFCAEDPVRCAHEIADYLRSALRNQARHSRT